MFPRDVLFVHASRDKLSHVQPLESALSARGISSWIDSGQIKTGQSITKLVGLGLQRASLVLLLITENFINRPWPEKELHAALAMEIESGQDTLIPIADVSRRQMIESYPLLADKRMLEWSAGTEALAVEIAAWFKRTPAEWHIGFHPKKFKGPVWTRLTPISDNAEAHEVTAVWGMFRFVTTVRTECSVSLTHHKTEDSDWPLYVRVSPPAIITFGQGPPPDQKTINIDEGWTRLAGAPIM